MSQQLFSSESVTEGHPDKVCNRVSDAILDALLTADPRSRVAVETMAATGLIHIAGEVTTEAYVRIPEIVYHEIPSIGYNSSCVDFDGASYSVSVSLDGQNPSIAGGVDEALEMRGTQSGDPRDRLGAGDQGIMFGYTSSDTPDLTSAPIWSAHRPAKRLTDVRKQGTVEGLRPDGKTQVTLAHVGSRPVGIDTVVMSTQHDEALSQSTITDTVRDYIINPVVEESDLALASGSMTALVNPPGCFVLDGPATDASLTGRKIIVDTYGGVARHGGGASSGEDPSKVNRSAIYAAHWVAKNVVATGIAQRYEIQLAYAIRRAHPIGLYIDTFGTTSVPEDHIADTIREIFGLRPLSMVEGLNLLRLIYRETAAYDHFNCDQFPWEVTNRVEQLKATPI